MDKNTVFVIVVIWLSILFVIFMYFFVKVLIEFRKDDLEDAGRINEKSLKTLKNQLKMPKAIDQQQADRIGLLLKESLSLLSQKKISKE